MDLTEKDLELILDLCGLDNGFTTMIEKRVPNLNSHVRRVDVSHLGMKTSLLLQKLRQERAKTATAVQAKSPSAPVTEG